MVRFPFFVGDEVNLKIGSDPEFVLYNKNNPKRAIQAKWVIQDKWHNRPLGLDSCGTIGEIRAKPSTEPVTHLRHIAKIMKYFVEQYPQYNMSVLRSKIQVGGHIHFSDSPYGRTTCVALLDKFLTVPFSCLVPHRVFMPRRKDYGELGNERNAEHVGWEYRSIPSWLCNPETGRMVLEIAYLIVSNAHRLPNFMDYRVVDAYYKHDIESLKPHVRLSMETLKCLPAARKCRDSIDKLDDSVYFRDQLHESDNCAESWLEVLKK